MIIQSQKRQRAEYLLIKLAGAVTIRPERRGPALYAVSSETQLIINARRTWKGAVTATLHVMGQILIVHSLTTQQYYWTKTRKGPPIEYFPTCLACELTLFIYHYAGCWLAGSLSCSNSKFKFDRFIFQLSIYYWTSFFKGSKFNNFKKIYNFYMYIFTYFVEKILGSVKSVNSMLHPPLAISGLFPRLFSHHIIIHWLRVSGQWGRVALGLAGDTDCETPFGSQELLESMFPVENDFTYLCNNIPCVYCAHLGPVPTVHGSWQRFGSQHSLITIIFQTLIVIHLPSILLIFSSVI